MKMHNAIDWMTSKATTEDRSTTEEFEFVSEFEGTLPAAMHRSLLAWLHKEYMKTWDGNNDLRINKSDFQKGGGVYTINFVDADDEYKVIGIRYSKSGTKVAFWITHMGARKEAA